MFTPEDAIGRSKLGAPHVLVKLDVTPDDYVTVQRYFFHRTRWAAFPIWEIILSLLCMIGFVLFSGEDRENWKILVVCGLVFVTGTLSYPLFLTWLEGVKLVRLHQEMSAARKHGLPPVYFIL